MVRRLLAEFRSAALPLGTPPAKTRGSHYPKGRSMPWRYLITGATGFVGGHIAEAFVEHGWPVSAIVRPTSDTSFLQQLGVKLHTGELNDAKLAAEALADVDVVVHTAAKVGDWGPVE